MIVVCVVSFFAAGLTLFSGFGLGTILLPAFALFFPLPAAVALTAVVHLLNNLLKLALLGRHADRAVAVRFGLPAMAAAFAGAWVLARLSGRAALLTYAWGNRAYEVQPAKLAVALLMIGFALLEVSGAEERVRLDRRFLPLGGLLSGFFGGVSGHQGALRAMFLLKCGFSKETFLGTGVVIACLVDLTRLGVYAVEFPWPDMAANRGLLVAATASAFAGTWIGNRLVEKITLRGVRWVVSGMLALIAFGLAAGVI